MAVGRPSFISADSSALHLGHISLIDGCLVDTDNTMGTLQWMASSFQRVLSVSQGQLLYKSFGQMLSETMAQITTSKIGTSLACI